MVIALLLFDLCALMCLLLFRVFAAAAGAAVAYLAVATATSSQARAFAPSRLLGVDLVQGIAGAAAVVSVRVSLSPQNGLPHVSCMCSCLPAPMIRVAAVGVECFRVLGAMRLSIL